MFQRVMVFQRVIVKKWLSLYQVSIPEGDDVQGDCPVTEGDDVSESNRDLEGVGI